MWRIYYDNGSIFSSEDGAWNDAPSDGVLFIIEKTDAGINVFSGNDFYIMDGDITQTGDLNPFLRKLKVIKFGRFTSHKAFELVAAQVREDCKKWQRSSST